MKLSFEQIKAAYDQEIMSGQGGPEAVDTGGDEQSTLHIVDVATAEPLPDAIPHTRAAAIGCRHRCSASRPSASKTATSSV